MTANGCFPDGMIHCGVGEPIVDNINTMFGIDFQKAFRGNGKGANASRDYDDEEFDGAGVGSRNIEGTSIDSNDHGLNGSVNSDDEEKKETFGAEASFETNRNKNEAGNKNDNNDQNDNDDDVHQMLEDMEIPDFDMSADECDTNDNATGTKEADQIEDKGEEFQWKSIDWNVRQERDEIYSKRYKPSKSERKELEAMATHLGVSAPNGIFGMSLRASVQLGMGPQNMDNVDALFYAGGSIMLKVGDVQWNESDAGLILLTEGFVIMYRNFNTLNPLEKRYETCQLWRSVEYCEKIDDSSFAIQLESEERFELQVVEDGESVDGWMEALERIIVEHALHRGRSDSSFLDVSGWQHKLIHSPGFTAAITGDVELLGAPEQLNELDKYNECAPLHYALQQEECNPEVVKALLEHGADPNFQDEEGRSAMYYAERCELGEIREMLEEHGGKASKLAEVEERGFLFRSSEQAKINTAKRREREKLIKENEQAMRDKKATEANEKAQSAQSEMGKAMSALVERGEKIKQLDEKTREMEEEAKTYGELAARLKEEVKNKKKKKWFRR